MAESIKKEYDNLCKKYRLPKFDDLDSEFEISDLESTNFLLKNILRKIAENLEFYNGLINEVLQPDAASMSSMHETRFFTDSEKSDMYSLYKKIMKNHRAIIEIMLKNDEKEEAEFLNKFLNDWKEIKKWLLNYLEKMKDSWDKETSIEQDLGYFG
ncbi:hypothetical protein HYU09_01435 [Candidatus Woesearchaeota archaeon]|nr:hypothetical protein [Candidatus Woesearchaeota archaeon]